MRWLLIFSLAGLLIPAPTLHGQTGFISGKIVYTAELAGGDVIQQTVGGSGANDVMLSNTIGADVRDGRNHLAGGPAASAAYPRLSKTHQFVACHAFPDPNADGTVDHSQVAAVVGVLNQDGSELTNLTDPVKGAASGANWSPDERRLVFGYAKEDTDGDGLITTQDRNDLALLELGAVDPNNPSPTQLKTDREPVILASGNFSVFRPQFMGSERIVFEATSTTDGTHAVYIYDLNTATLIRLDAPGEAFRPAPSPDGQQVAVEIFDGTERYVSIYDARTDEWERISPRGFDAEHPTWAGNIVAMAASNVGGSSIILWDGEAPRLLLAHAERITGPLLSPDARAVAYGIVLPSSGNTVLAVATLDGGFQTELSPHDSNVIDYDWVP